MRVFFGKAYATFGGVEYGPFDVDLEYVLDWSEVFTYIEDDLRGKWQELIDLGNKLHTAATGEEDDEEAEFPELASDWEIRFDKDDHDDFFSNAFVKDSDEYDWQKHDQLLDGYNTAGNDDDDTLNAIVAYVNAGCSGSYFGQAYQGMFPDGGAFAENYWSEMMDDRHLLGCLVIDWEATWQGMYDFVEYDGYYFRNM